VSVVPAPFAVKQTEKQMAKPLLVAWDLVAGVVVAPVPGQATEPQDKKVWLLAYVVNLSRSDSLRTETGQRAWYDERK
jgi:hypothetical protein